MAKRINLAAACHQRLQGIDMSGIRLLCNLWLLPLLLLLGACAASSPKHQQPRPPTEQLPPAAHWSVGASEPVRYKPRSGSQTRDDMPQAGPISSGGSRAERSTALVAAAARGDVEGIARALHGGVEATAGEGAAVTAAAAAAAAAQAAAAALAADPAAGDDGHLGGVNWRDGDGWSALLYAASEGHLAAVEVLLAAGANPNLRDTHDGWTALTHACSNGATDVVAALLRGGAKVNATDVQVRRWTS